MNDLSLPTHIVPNKPLSNSIIDLTFLNSRAVDAWPHFNWEVEDPASGKSLGSDHMAITWSIEPHNQAKSDGVTEPSPRHLINVGCQDKWLAKYSQLIKEANLPPNPSTAKDADQMVGAILTAMSSATEATMPKPKRKKGKGPAQSPWWSDKCSVAVHNLRHNPNHRTRDQLWAALQGAIRRARRNRGEKILAEIQSSKVFDVLSWSQGKRRALMPPLKSKSGGPTATHPFQKAVNLAKQFFPPGSSPNISLEPLGIKAHPKRDFQPISCNKIRESLAQTSNKSAPGAFGLNYRLLKWAFDLDPTLFESLFNLCLRIGYHPSALRNSIIAPIPKPRHSDMLLPKNYRPIALLETLSKLLEKVITKRLIFKAGANNLIPHSQFGGRNITSCTDAGLCMIHNIHNHWRKKHNVTLLTLDVSGYFNNVDHNRLIYTLDRLGYHNNICNWLKSYLSNRTAQFRINGTICPQIQLPSVGVPQGSPLSPVLSSLYSIPLLLASVDPQAHSFAYIDDFTILAYSKTHHKNIKIIKDIINRINSTAIHLGLEFELDKSDLIHFICNKLPHSSPSLTISYSGTDTVIEPRDCIRWLGFFLDRKLTFKEHIANMATKAKAAIAGLRMFANTQQGLSIRHTQILFKACIIPILTYGVPLWFHGHRQQLKLKPLRVVQNEGIRWLLGAFRTTPVHNMEHLASIPPLHITCQKIIQNASAKLQSIPTLAKVAKRLPRSWDTSLDKHRPDPKASPINCLALHSHPQAEFIMPYTVHPSKPSNPFPNQLTVDPSSRGLKQEDYTETIQEEVRLEENNPASGLGFSDGHAAVSKGILKIGIGYVFTHMGIQRSIGSKGIGPRASIFDAEMLGLATCAANSTSYATKNGITNLYLYCNNQAAVRRISTMKPHPAQFASIIFHRAVRTFLEGHPERTIIVRWIPGHSGIKGNELADKLAKGGANVPPTPIFNCTITWTKTQATNQASRSWKKIWDAHTTKRPDSNQFIPNKPSLKLHPIFNKCCLPRDITSRLVQLLTRHGFYGEYRNRFHPDLNPRCTCGEGVQTVIHTMLFCPSTEGQRHILSECSPELSERVLFGSLAGLKAVSKFIAESGIGKFEGPPAAALNL